MNWRSIGLGIAIGLALAVLFLPRQPPVEASEALPPDRGCGWMPPERERREDARTQPTSIPHQVAPPGTVHIGGNPFHYPPAIGYPFHPHTRVVGTALL